MDESENTIEVSDSLAAQAGCPEKYAIKGLIGQGGMGMVLHAVDCELNRQVAIKILFYDGARERESQERFLREAQILSRLEHMNIVRIYSSGLNKFGNPYHVMEYLQGTPLMQELERGTLSPESFYELFKQVLAGLEHAHQNKIVHRDLKPSNIMHCVDEEGRALYKLIDFGIAKIETPATGKTLTRTNSIMGSPFYISPEQCRGERGDYLSDIYSIACVMYECISGNPPFKGDTSFETMMKHIAEQPAKLASQTQSQKSLRLSDLLSRCMEKDPAARPQRISEISSELDEIFSDKTEQLDLFKARKTNPKGSQWLARAAVAAAISITLGVAAWACRAAMKPASSELRLNQGEEKIARQLAKYNAAVNKIESSICTQSSPGLKLKYIDSLFALGRNQIESKRYAAAEKSYDKAIAFCESCGSGLEERRAASIAMRAKARWKQGKFKNAEADYDKALEATNSLKKKQKELQIDMIFERSVMRLHERKFIAARDDFNYADSLFTQLRSGIGKLQEIDTIYQELDKGGQNRSDLAYAMVKDLEEMKPANSEEAVGMLLLSNKLAERLSHCPLRLHEEIQHILNISLQYLPAVNGNESLKKETCMMVDLYKKHQVKAFDFSIQDAEKSEKAAEKVCLSK